MLIIMMNYINNSSNSLSTRLAGAERSPAMTGALNLKLTRMCMSTSNVLCV